MPSRNLRDGIAFGSAFMVLILLTLVFKFNIVLAGVSAILVFVGLYFILNPQTLQQVAETQMRRLQTRSSGSSVGLRIQISQARNLGGRVRNANIREGMLNVVESTEKLLIQLERSPQNFDYVMIRLEYGYTLLLKLIGYYIGLTHDGRTQKQADEIATQLEQPILGVWQNSLIQMQESLTNGTTRLNLGGLDQAFKELETIIKTKGNLL